MSRKLLDRFEYQKFQLVFPFKKLFAFAVKDFHSTFRYYQPFIKYFYNIRGFFYIISNIFRYYINALIAPFTHFINTILLKH